MTSVQKILFQFQDEKYAGFTAKLVPTEPREAFIGVRSPAYKKIVPLVLALPAVELDAFRKALPHQFHEENCLHIALINSMKDYDACVAELERFMPFVTNWSVSDGLFRVSLRKKRKRSFPGLKRGLLLTRRTRKESACSFS